MKYIDYIVEMMKVEQFLSLKEKEIEKFLPSAFFEFFGEIELGQLHWDRLYEEMGDTSFDNVENFFDNKETPEQLASRLLKKDPTLSNKMTFEEIQSVKNELRDNQSNLTTLIDNLKSVGVHFGFLEQIDLLKIEKML